MAQHFTQSKEYRDLTEDEISDLTPKECLELFIKARWECHENICCPDDTCKSKEKYFISTRNQWRCKCCGYTYSVTSKTKFHSHKKPLKKLIKLVYSFTSAPQGCSANSQHSKFGMTVKAARLNYHKIREVLFDTNVKFKLSGTVHIDGLHICGKPRKANKRQKSDSIAINAKLRNRKASITPTPIPITEPWNVEKFKNRRIILALAELNQSSFDAKGTNRVLAFVVKAETASEVLSLIEQWVATGSCIMTDSGNAYSRLEAKYDHRTVNHSQEYMKEDGTNNNQAEAFFSRIRRAEYGVYNGMRSKYLYLYLAEFAWRSNTSKMTLKTKFDYVLQAALKSSPHSVFKNYDHKSTQVNRNEVLYR